MDLTPFLEFDILNPRKNIVAEVKKFHKNAFDIDNVFSTASELKYSKAIKDFFSKQLKQPTDCFVKYVLSEVYSGKRTQATIENFKPIVEKSLNDLIGEMMTDKISAALKKDVALPQPEGKVEDYEGDAEIDDIKSDALAPTDEEMQCYYIMKSMLGKVLPLERITYKKTATYFKIKLDGMVTRWICRFYIKEKSRFVQIPDSEKKAIRYDFQGIDEIYALENKIIGRATAFVEQ